LYLMWLVELFALQVAATLQLLGGRRLDELEQRKEPTGLIDPASILLIMQVVAERFERGQPTTPRHVAQETGVAEPIVGRMFDRLVEAGYLHRVDRENAAVTLARPPEQVSADRLIEIGFAMVDEVGSGRRSDLVQRLRDAQRQLAGQVTLAALVGAAPAVPAADQAPHD